MSPLIGHNIEKCGIALGIELGQGIGRDENVVCSTHAWILKKYLNLKKVNL